MERMRFNQERRGILNEFRTTHWTPFFAYVAGFLVTTNLLILSQKRSYVAENYHHFGLKFCKKWSPHFTFLMPQFNTWQSPSMCIHLCGSPSMYPPMYPPSMHTPSMHLFFLFHRKYFKQFSSWTSKKCFEKPETSQRNLLRILHGTS